MLQRLRYLVGDMADEKNRGNSQSGRNRLSLTRFLSRKWWVGIAAIVALIGTILGILAATQTSPDQSNNSVRAKNGNCVIQGGNNNTCNSGQVQQSAAPVAGSPIPASSLGCPTAPPYSPLLAAVYHETSSDHPGLATVFPGKVNLSKADLQHLNKEGSVAWLAGRDGYDGYDTHVKLTLTGCQSVRILSMRAIILSRSRPLHGTIFQPASQGGIVSLTLRFNLDSGSPVATQIDNTGNSFNYFERYTFTLAPHEQHTFEIIGTTLRSSVTWMLDVAFLFHNKTINETIENGSQPFRTTALLKNTGSPSNPYPHYGAAYAECYGYGGQPFPAVCSHLAPGTSWVRAK